MMTHTPVCFTDVVVVVVCSARSESDHLPSHNELLDPSSAANGGSHSLASPPSPSRVPRLNLASSPPLGAEGWNASEVTTTIALEYNSDRTHSAQPTTHHHITTACARHLSRLQCSRRVTTSLS